MSDKQMMTQENQVAEETKPLFWATPQVDIYESQEELVLIADLPGVNETDLQLEVERGVLTLEATAAPAEDGRAKGFYRQFKLSDQINGDAGNASLQDGVLTLRLPKAEEAKPKKSLSKLSTDSRRTKARV